MRHRELFRQREQCADVIAVIMGRPHVIDLRDAGGRERLDDAAEIAVAGVAGVDEQRLPRGTDEERRLPALGVDVVDVQRAGARSAPIRPMTPAKATTTTKLRAWCLSHRLTAFRIVNGSSGHRMEH